MKTGRDERERLVAAATSAYRRTDADGAILVDPAWLDLDAAGRAEAFAETVRVRALEAAADPDGLSSTARAVLARITRASR
jgi:hypothetical protein